MRPKAKKLMIIAPLAILGMLLFVFIGGELVMRLWNWLLPPLFGFREITFWQGLGLLALCRILFGGLGIRSASGGGVRRRMAERWGHMPPDERERLRQVWRERWGFGPPTEESKG
jgi:hypothetical protein